MSFRNSCNAAVPIKTIHNSSTAMLGFKELCKVRADHLYRSIAVGVVSQIYGRVLMSIEMHSVRVYGVFQRRLGSLTLLFKYFIP